MIIGIGTDIVEISRLQQSLERSSGDAFLQHCFTPLEQAEAPENPRQKFAYFAGRWAAKEALSKAFGTGIGSKCMLREIEIRKGNSGQPVIFLKGITAATAETLGIRKLHVSISHERSYACAVVLAEG